MTAASTTDEFVTELAGLVDRERQWLDIKDRLERRGPGPGGPLFVVLPGETADMHRVFIKRCAKYAVPRLLGSDSWLLPGEQLPWPRHARRIDEAFAPVAVALGLPETLAPAKVAERLRDLGCSVCLGVAMTGRVWSQHRDGLFAEWAHTLNAALRPLPASRCALVFVSLVLDARDPEPDEREIAAALAARAPAGAPGLDLLVLPRLAQVGWEDVDDWLFTCSVERRRFPALDLNLLQGVAHEIFGDELSPKPMASVYDILTRKLGEACRGRGPEFVRG